MIIEYKLANGEIRYGFRTYFGKDPETGKDIRPERQGFKTEREAILAESRLRVDYEEKGFLTNGRMGRHKFEEVYKLWFAQYEHTVKENTFATQKMVADKHILPHFKDYYIAKISVKKCQEVVNQWYKTYTKAANLVSVVNRIFGLAISLNYCDNNPMSKVMRPKNTHKKEHEALFYDKKQLLQFFECLNESESVMNITLFRLLAFSGIRKGELMGLQWQDLDETHGVLHIRRVLAKGEKDYIFQEPKTKSSKRYITLDHGTINQLKTWRLEQRKTLFKLGINSNNKEQLIFTNSKNEHIKSEFPNRVLNRVIKKYHLPKIDIHGFRHTHCSLLFEAGVQMKEVQERLGHSSITTTMNIYAHVTKKQKDETAERFANFMSALN